MRCIVNNLKICKISTLPYPGKISADAHGFDKRRDWRIETVRATSSEHMQRVAEVSGKSALYISYKKGR